MSRLEEITDILRETEYARMVRRLLAFGGDGLADHTATRQTLRRLTSTDISSPSWAEADHAKPGESETDREG